MIKDRNMTGATVEPEAPAIVHLTQIGLIALLGWLLLLGRLMVPGHGASLPGSYEAFAHVGVGALIGLLLPRLLPPVRLMAWATLILTTAFEGVMFGARSGWF